MAKVTMGHFLSRPSYMEEDYVKAIWPIVKIDMTHAIKYYRIATQKATEKRLLAVLSRAWQIEGFTLNNPGPEVNLVRWVLDTADVWLLFAIALELEGELEGI